MVQPLARTPNYGRVGGQLAEQLAWLTSPAKIHGEIAHHQRAIQNGDTSPQTVALLRDWERVLAAQRALFAKEGDE